MRGGGGIGARAKGGYKYMYSTAHCSIKISKKICYGENLLTFENAIQKTSGTFFLGQKTKSIH